MAARVAAMAIALALLLSTTAPAAGNRATAPTCAPCGKGWPHRCRPGATCTTVRGVGVGVSLCVAQVAAGGACRLPCNPCRRGLMCGPSGRCAPPPVLQCGPCSFRQRCVAGTACRRMGPTGRRCVEEVGLGQWCTGPCRECRAGLTCGPTHRCLPPPRQAPLVLAADVRCQACGGAGDRPCAAGSTCTERGGVRTCVKEMGPGAACFDPCWVCGTGLVCATTGVCDFL